MKLLTDLKKKNFFSFLKPKITFFGLLQITELDLELDKPIFYISNYENSVFLICSSDRKITAEGFKRNEVKITQNIALSCFQFHLR